MLTRTAACAASSPSPARISSGVEVEPVEHRAGVGAAQQRLGGLLGGGPAQAPVAEHHVDAVPGRGVRRGHALEVVQPGQRVGGSAGDEADAVGDGEGGTTGGTSDNGIG